MNDQIAEKNKSLGFAQAFSLYQSSNKIPSSWVEISTSALYHNIEQYRSIVPTGTYLIPVIKSNAYGHGLLQVGYLLDQNKSVNAIGVVALSEAVQLRAAGITKDILVLGIIDAPLQTVIDLGLQLVVYDELVIAELDQLAEFCNKSAKIHIKVDTGLSRLGFLPDDAFECIQRTNSLKHIEIAGISTHFANSENKDDAFVKIQLSRFKRLLERLQKLGIHIPLQHVSCSAALSGYKEAHFSAVRFGIGLYGLWPSQENKVRTLQNYPHFNLKPVLTWKTRIIQIKTIPAGSFVGYNLTHRVEIDTKIGVLPIGYWDGIDRNLSNKGSVMVNGRIAKMIGTIAMNLCMIDLSGIDVQVNDEVLLLGEHEMISAQAIACHTDTINYEVVTRINPLLPRVVAL